MDRIVKTALLNALGIAVYVILIASFFSFMQINFKETPDAFIAPIVMLLLLMLFCRDYGVFGFW